MNPEARKAFEAFMESIGLSLEEINMNTQHGTPLSGCVGDCMPPILPKPTTDAITEGLVTVFKIFERIKSVNYNKGETEIKIEIVIDAPQKIPSAVFGAKGSGGKI